MSKYSPIAAERTLKMPMRLKRMWMQTVVWGLALKIRKKMSRIGHHWSHSPTNRLMDELKLTMEIP